MQKTLKLLKVGLFFSFLIGGTIFTDLLPNKDKTEKGKKSNKVTKNGLALIKAAGQGRLKEVKRLLGEEEVDVDSIDKRGETALIRAAYKGKYDIVRFLVKNGANVNKISNFRDTALSSLIVSIDAHKEKGKSEYQIYLIIKFLCKNGARVWHQDRDGNTIWDYEVDMNRKDKVLLALYMVKQVVGDLVYFPISLFKKN
ncbi:ankyrin repeat domain-containing protein [Candidatus Dependentiae bacterium]